MNLSTDMNNSTTASMMEASAEIEVTSDPDKSMEDVIDALWTVGFTVIVIGGTLGNGIVFWIIVGKTIF